MLSELHQAAEREVEAAEQRIAELERALDEADDPNRPPYGICQGDGCKKWANVGTPTSDGYKWLCHDHWKVIAALARKETP